jgi:hypothetical protein
MTLSFMWELLLVQPVLLEAPSMSQSQMKSPDLFEERQAIPWLRLLLLLLLCEKVIQHGAVTIAFALDLAHLRARVAVDYRVFLFAGAALTILYAVCVWGLLRRKRWLSGAVAILALVDIVGEFFAQGTVLIVLNISFLVALALLVLTALYRPDRNR